MNNAMDYVREKMDILDAEVPMTAEMLDICNLVNELNQVTTGFFNRRFVDEERIDKAIDSLKNLRIKLKGISERI